MFCLWQVTGSLLHYFLLTSFCWITISSFTLYSALSSAHINRFMLKSCLVAWGLPLIIVGVVLAIDTGHYHSVQLHL